MEALHHQQRDAWSTKGCQGGFPVNAKLVNTTSITTTKLGKRTSLCGPLTHRTSEGALNGGITNRIVVNGHPREGCLKIGPSYGYSLIIFPNTDLKFLLGSLSNMSNMSLLSSYLPLHIFDVKELGSPGSPLRVTSNVSPRRFNFSSRTGCSLERPTSVGKIELWGMEDGKAGTWWNQRNPVDWCTQPGND